MDSNLSSGRFDMKKQINRHQRLDLLADKMYKNTRAWKDIRTRNGMTMPFGPQLKPGQVIQVPGV